MSGDATIGPSYGQARVYVDGKLAATLNLYASTDGGPKVSVDALAILE